MTDHNMLSIEELIAVIQSLPQAGIDRDDLLSALQHLRTVRIQERPSTEALIHAMMTGDCSGRERKAS